MVGACVVILSSQSLFAEGIASRLQQHLQTVEFEMVDAEQPDAVAQITAVRPSAVILDVTDPESAQFCSLGKLLLSLPKLAVICLDLKQELIQVVTSEQHRALTGSDLAEVIERSL